MRKKHLTIIDERDTAVLLKELDNWRKFHNISKAKLAKKIGLRSYIALYYWNTGKHKPYPRHRWRIIQLLGKKLSVEEYKQWQKERIKWRKN